MSEAKAPQPAVGYLRVWDIVGDRKRGIEPLIPVSRTTWWNGVKEGKYPKPVKLSERVTVWKRADIMGLLENIGGAA